MDRKACILLLNDIHVSKDNILEFNINWDEALSVCDRLQIREVVLGGDLFMSRAAQTLDVLLAVRDAFVRAEKAEVYVTVMNGNHDKVDQEANRGYCHVFDQHKNVSVVDDYISLCLSNEWRFVLHALAYFPERGSFEDKLKDLVLHHLDEKRLNYLYAHEGVNGALKHSSENELSPDVFKAFDKVFVGHYHDRKTIEGTSIEYIGASRQHNFGEDEEKGYTVVYEDGNYDFVKNERNSRFSVVEVAAEGVDVHLLNRLEGIREDERYKVKVRVRCPGAKVVSIDKEKLLQAGASKVEILVEEDIAEATGSSLFNKFDNQEIIKNYEVFCDEKRIEDVDLGLSYLSKI